MSYKGLVFSVEEFSVFDGPGIRTTVFLKGCPLRCSWCHNPEGQSFKKEIVKSPNGCIGCGSCKDLWNKPEFGEKCIGICPQNLIRYSGTEYTSDELCQKILKNSVFFKDGGGVTFSGGEPLAQADFLYECLLKLNGKVNRCIQSSGFCDGKTFKKILSETDYFLYDIKIIDKDNLYKHTGADSDVILSNFKVLVAFGVPFTVRIPLIPGVTDTKENIADILDLLASCNITYAEALPYNKNAGAKYKLCNRTYEPRFDASKEVYIPIKEFKEKGIELKVL